MGCSAAGAAELVTVVLLFVVWEKDCWDKTNVSIEIVARLFGEIKFFFLIELIIC